MNLDEGTVAALPPEAWADGVGRGRRMALLALLVLLAAVLALGVGAVAIPPQRVLELLLARAGLIAAADPGAADAAVLWAIRVPRVLAGVLVGAGLSVSGALMQGLFRNPLAEPGLVGVSAGAAAAAALAIVLGGPLLTLLPPALGPALLPGAAFIGGLLATGVALRVGRGADGDRGRLLLAGVAISAVSMALTGLLVTVASDAQLRSLTFWSLGSLGGVTWPALALLGLLVLPPLLLVGRLANALDALAAGDRAALHLGVDVRRLERAAVLLTALVTGACVAATGVIGFVGLVVPHLARRLLGADHRGLLPASALLGALLLTLADLLARTVAAPVELPIGAVTALVGGPFFLWRLRRVGFSAC